MDAIPTDLSAFSNKNTKFVTQTALTDLKNEIYSICNGITIHDNLKVRDFVAILKHIALALGATE